MKPLINIFFGLGLLIIGLLISTFGFYCMARAVFMFIEDGLTLKACFYMAVGYLHANMKITNLNK